MIYFRADQNRSIASGHVMRCLSLADKFRECGASVVFLVSDSNPVNMIASRGYKAIVLNTDWTNLILEVPLVSAILKKDKRPTLIVDTYQVTREYVEALSPIANVCYLGSKLDFLGPLYALINYSTNIDEIFYLNNYKQFGTKLLLGPRYAPLRKEFQGWSPKFSSQVTRILVTTGNTDSENIVGALIERMISSNDMSSVCFDVVVGSMFANRDYLYDTYSSNSRVHLYERVKSMSALMEQCDIAISANGTTVYELAAAGVPAITFAMVDEQIPSAKALDKIGAVRYCGDLTEGIRVCTDSIYAALNELCFDYSARRFLADRAHQLIDGNGCERIARILLDEEKANRL